LKIFGAAGFEESDSEFDSKTNAMNTKSLSHLHRRMTADAVRDVDADALLAALEGRPADAARRTAAVEALADSAAHADLARMLGALQADSETLAADVRRVRTAMPARVQRERRHGHASRVRWAAPLAACMTLVVAVFAIHERDARHHAGAWNDVAASTHSVAQPDRIFSTRDEIFSSSEEGVRHAGGTLPDEVFRSDFSEGGS